MSSNVRCTLPGRKSASSFAVRVEPNSTTSAPAATELAAAAGKDGVTALIAPADKLSVTTKPGNPSEVRSTPDTTDGDNDAGREVRPGTVAFATITAGAPAVMAAEKGGKADSLRLESGRVAAGPTSVLPVDPPRPGKCLITGRTPPSRNPLTNATT